MTENIRIVLILMMGLITICVGAGGFWCLYKDGNDKGENNFGYGAWACLVVVVLLIVGMAKIGGVDLNHM